DEEPVVTQGLYSRQADLVYPIVSDIPVMLIDEALPGSEASGRYAVPPRAVPPTRLRPPPRFRVPHLPDLGGLRPLCPPARALDRRLRARTPRPVEPAHPRRVSAPGVRLADRPLGGLLAGAIRQRGPRAGALAAASRARRHGALRRRPQGPGNRPRPGRERRGPGVGRDLAVPARGRRPEQPDPRDALALHDVLGVGFDRGLPPPRDGPGGSGEPPTPRPCLRHSLRGRATDVHPRRVRRNPGGAPPLRGHPAPESASPPRRHPRRRLPDRSRRDPRTHP